MADPLDEEIQRAASFAGNFVGGTTNLAQRARYRRDIEAGDQLDEQTAAAARERRFLGDKTYQSGVLGRERLEQASTRIGLDRSRMEEARRKSIFDQSIAERRLQIAEQTAEEKRAKDDLDSANALRIKANNTSLYRGLADINKRGLQRGSKEFADEAMKLLISNPDADRGLRQALLADADVEDDIESFEKAIARVPADMRSRVRATSGQKGWSFSVGPETATKPVDEAAKLRKELDAAAANLSSWQARKDAQQEVPEGLIELYQQDVKRLMGQIQGASTSAPASTAAPVTKQFRNKETNQMETFNLVNGQWLKAQ